LSKINIYIVAAALWVQQQKTCKISHHYHLSYQVVLSLQRVYMLFNRHIHVQR